MLFIRQKIVSIGYRKLRHPISRLQIVTLNFSPSFTGDQWRMYFVRMPLANATRMSSTVFTLHRSNYELGISTPLRGLIPKGQILSGPIPKGLIRYADWSTLWMYPKGNFVPTSFDVFFNPTTSTLFSVNVPKRPITLAIRRQRSLGKREMVESGVKWNGNSSTFKLRN